MFHFLYSDSIDVCASVCVCARAHTTSNVGVKHFSKTSLHFVLCMSWLVVDAERFGALLFSVAIERF